MIAGVLREVRGSVFSKFQMPATIYRILHMHRILETTQSSIDPALGPVITGVVRVISAGIS